MTIFSRGCLIFACLLFLTGCPSGKSAPSGSGGKSTGGGKASPERCEDNLNTAFSSLDPRRLELDADIESTVNVLNDWLTSCGSAQEFSTEEQTFFHEFLSEEELRTLQTQQFISRDIGQIRTNILLRKMAEVVTTDAASDLEKVVRLFEYVTRNVILQPDNQQLPLTLYEVVLFGRATSEHQAWAFAELLHQLKIDSVILTPSGDGSQDEWIFAVCLDDGNYLFDFSLLTPVPVGGETPAWPIVQPATLEQAIETPEILTSLKELGSQTPTAEKLQSPQVWIPSESSYWSPRMQALNRSLSGKPFQVADPLLDGGNVQGILSRIDKASDLWKRSDIKPWPFPAQQLQGYWSIEDNSSQAQALYVRKLPLKAPMEISVDQETKEVSIRQESNLLWESRLEQLRGRYQLAISTYGTLRLGSRGTKSIFPGQENNSKLQDFMRREDAAAEDAHFWVGVSQVEVNQYSDAAVTLGDYLNRYPDSSWTDAVHMLLAGIELKKDDRAEAIEQLSQVPQNSLMRPAADFIRSRLESPETEKTDSP